MTFCRSTFRFPARFGLRCSGRNQVVGLANEGFEFIRGKNVRVGERYPLVASDVGRGGDAFDLQQFVECFRRAFESDVRESSVREDHAGEDFAANFETEVVAPAYPRLRRGRRGRVCGSIRRRAWGCSGSVPLFRIPEMPSSNARMVRNYFGLHRVRIASPISDVIADHRSSFVTIAEGKHVGVPPKALMNASHSRGRCVK